MKSNRGQTNEQRYKNPTDIAWPLSNHLTTLSYLHQGGTPFATYTFIHLTSNFHSSLLLLLLFFNNQIPK